MYAQTIQNNMCCIYRIHILSDGYQKTTELIKKEEKNKEVKLFYYLVLSALDNKVITEGKTAMQEDKLVKIWQEDHG